MYLLSVYIENERIELFKDETVSFNSTVQNIKDISKIFTDFTQTFTVPASSINNKIFKHWYNVDITGGFDARIKTSAILELNGVTFKTGSIRMESTTLKGGSVSAYKITFFGLLVSLKDTFSDDFIDGLDLSAFNHTFDFSTVSTGVSSGLSSGSIIYPLLSSVKRWYYSSDTADDTNTDTLVNIAYEVATDKGIKWNELKPAILVTDIIDAIETKYGITFSSDFIGTAPFDNLYLWLSREKGSLTNPSGGNEQLIDWTSETGSTGFINLGSDRFAIFNINNRDFTYDITVTPLDVNQEYSIIIRDAEKGDAIIAQKLNVKGVQSIAAMVDVVPLSFDIGFYVSAAETFTYSATVDIESENRTSGFVVSDDYTAASNSLTGTLNVANFLPRMKVIDFLNGIIKAYNLVIIPTTETSFFIDTLDSWYAAGNEIDISKYIDTKKTTVKRVDIPREIDLKFVEGKSFLMDTFQEQNNTNYGDLSLLLDDGAGNVFLGSELPIGLPFEQVLYERLVDANTSTNTDIQIGYVVDGQEATYNLKAHLFYSVNQSTVGKTFALLNDAGSPTEKTTAYMPFHGDTTTSPSYSTLWGSDLNEWDGLAITNSLFNLYYEDYITDLFSIKRRLFTFKAIIPQHILNIIELNDKLVINNRLYIINNINANLINGKTTFELLNDV